MLKCKVCGSTNLDFKVWVNQIEEYEALKNGTPFRTEATPDDPYCNECDEHVQCE